MILDMHRARSQILTHMLLMLVWLCAGSLAGCGDHESDGSDSQQLKAERVYGEPGTQRGQFVYPRALDVFNDHGHPFAAIVDKTARIQVMDLEDGRVVGAIHTPKWDRGKPTGLTVSVSALDPSRLAIYVADTHEHRVLMYQLPIADAEVPVPTEPDFQFGSFGEEPGQFIYPTDVAVEVGADHRVESIYVSEYGGNDRISRFDLNYDDPAYPKPIYRYQIGVVGQEVDASDAPIALARPQSIELWTDPEGRRELVLTDASHHRVGRVTTGGELIEWFGDPMDLSQGAMRFPYGLVILDDGTAIIAEFGGNVIRCLDLESGSTLWRYGSAGRSVGQIAQPWACGVLGDKLVILDSGNSRVQICDLPDRVSRLAAEYTRPDQQRSAAP